MPGGNGDFRRGRGLRPGRRLGRGRVALASFLAALSFLTVFPAGWGKTLSQRDISQSRAYYPLVGLVIGVLLVAVERGGREVFPPLLTAALLVAVLVVVSRGLHLDGFMDVCDGLFGGYTPQRRLEIMKDSRVGAFGVAGAATLMLVKYGALSSLLVMSASARPWALLMFPLLSRWAMVVALGAFPYARSQGLGAPFREAQAGTSNTVAGITAAAAAVLLGGIGGAGLLAGITALAWLLGRGMSHMLGGLTGDTYGAINEAAEAAALVALVGMAGRGWVGPLFGVPGV